MITSGLMSSDLQNWATPNDLFDDLNSEFGFEIDVCAEAWNAKCTNYYSKDDDGLAQTWHGVCWMNPPYGREISKWMKKAYESSLAGATVVCLVPARTDTAWWHDYAVKGEVRFLRGRVKYVHPSKDRPKPAPFPSAIIVFRNSNANL